jgi:hypothetical protein
MKNQLTTNRIVRDLPAEQYHSDLTTISKHGLDLIAQAPAVYRYKKLHAPPEKRTPALRWGTLVHLAVLEPHLLNEVCIVAPDNIDKRTKAGKAEWDAITETGREILTSAEMQTLAQIAKAVHLHPAAGKLLSGDVQIENSLYWEDSETGIACRARPDVIRCDGLIVDLKTTDDASPDGFRRSAFNYRYHVQAAFYLDALRACGGEAEAFVFIAVEKEAPHLVAAYVMESEFVEIGRQTYRRDLSTFARCLETNHWPGYPAEVQPLSAPAWALKNQN